MSNLADDPIDTGLRDLAAENADEVAAAAEAASQAAEDVASNTDGDPCNSFQWSIVFLLVMVMSLAVMILHLATLFRARKTGLTAFDVLTLALFAAIVVQFGPMASQVLHSGHGIGTFSQSGCKLLFYTDYGMRHVITFLVCSFFAWAYLILFYHFNPDNLDGKLRGNVAWLILLLFAIEGLFGMPAAIYIDVDPRHLQSCIWTPTLHLTLKQIVALEMVMRPITPYLLPFAIIAFPLVKVTMAWQHLVETRVKQTVFCCLVLTWSYFLMNLFYAVLLVCESSILRMDRTNFPWTVVCNMKWSFFLLHQCWFLLAPCALLALESEKGQKPPGSELAIAAFQTVVAVRKKVSSTRTRMV